MRPRARRDRRRLDGRKRRDPGSLDGSARVLDQRARRRQYDAINRRLSARTSGRDHGLAQRRQRRPRALDPLRWWTSCSRALPAGRMADDPVPADLRRGGPRGAQTGYGGGFSADSFRQGAATCPAAAGSRRASCSGSRRSGGGRSGRRPAAGWARPASSPATSSCGAASSTTRRCTRWRRPWPGFPPPRRPEDRPPVRVEYLAEAGGRPVPPRMAAVRLAGVRPAASGLDLLRGRPLVRMPSAMGRALQALRIIRPAPVCVWKGDWRIAADHVVFRRPARPKRRPSQPNASLRPEPLRAADARDGPRLPLPAPTARAPLTSPMRAEALRQRMVEEAAQDLSRTPASPMRASRGRLKR